MTGRLRSDRESLKKAYYIYYKPNILVNNYSTRFFRYLEIKNLHLPVYRDTVIYIIKYIYIIHIQYTYCYLVPLDYRVYLYRISYLYVALILFERAT